VTFKVVPGSAGAGHIAYRLRIANHHADCLFPTKPHVHLLARDRDGLPAHAIWPSTTHLEILIPADRVAAATATFSPDIPSGGEPQAHCERVAHTLILNIRTGALGAEVDPPTRVCGHGRMTFRAIHIVP
jgi:hypothetical protein